MSAQLFESSPVEPLVVGVHLYPGDTWFREVHVRSVTTQAPVDLSAWTFDAHLGDAVGVVDASRAAEGRIAMTFSPEQTAGAEWGDVVTLSGTLAGGRRTFLHGSVGAAVGSSIPVGTAQKTRVITSDVDISVYAAPRGDKGEDGSAVSVGLVQRAEGAEGRAVSAAGAASAAAGEAVGAASAAAGSAGSAAASAGAAAGSATTALSAAGGIVAAGDAAAASASKANTDADRAGTSAFNAAGSAASAQGSENAAVTARTGAETARTGAETARTGAETAKTAAETARDVALTTNFGGTAPAANTSLDTLTNVGVYRITWGATVAQGAPFEGFYGTIEVLPRAGGAVTQIALKHNALSADAAQNWQRTQTGAGWGAWFTYSSSRVGSAGEVFLRTSLTAEAQLATVGESLGTADLNNITKTGSYIQTTSTNATLARNYPSGSSAFWALEVIQVQSNLILQRATALNGIGANAGRGYWTRRLNGTTWDAWAFVSNRRVDETAGRAFYDWDYVNNREQLLHGDTGWRGVTNLLLNGWGTTALLLRRVGYRVTLNVEGFAAANSTSDIVLALPAGFTGSGMNSSPRGLLHSAATPAATYRTFLDANVNLRVMGATTGLPALFGELSWYTGDPWPTTLPGAAVGAIPSA